MIKRSADVLVPLSTLPVHHLLVFVLAEDVGQLGGFLLLDAMAFHRLPDGLHLALGKRVV